MKFRVAVWWVCIGVLALTRPPGLAQEPLVVSVMGANLSHRLVLLDTVEVRLKLMIGFSVSGDLPSGPAGTAVHATLWHAGSLVASYSMPRLDYPGGNVVFYMPYDIEPGDYDLHLELEHIATGDTVATLDHVVSNIEDLCARQGGNCDWMQPVTAVLNNPPNEPLAASPTPQEQQRGYVLWQRQPFNYVYPNSAPGGSDVASEVVVRMASGEYEPATFSIYALQDLAQVTISVSELADGGVTLNAPEIRVVKTVPRLTSVSGNQYEMRPRLLEETDSTAVGAGVSQRFWLTVHAPMGSRPGTYTGTITIDTSLGSAEVPMSVEVLPFALSGRPDKQYGLMMTYAFQEMTAQDLTDAERAKVYDSGLALYSSFREHGLTMVFPHSPFVFARRADGSPDLRDLAAALQAYEQVGFPGPFIYYCGHLVQTAKPFWAGSSLGYNSDYHPALMQEIVTYARANFSEMASVDFYWMPGDEIHDDRNGPDREAMTKELLDGIWAMGGEKTTVTARAQLDWPIDIRFFKPGWGSSFPLNGERWIFPNSDSVNTDPPDNAKKIRREFGLKHVASAFVGISPWSFQTSQNAAGDPYTDLDSVKGRPELMVAYPGVDGPVLTPEFEALREGIDDGKYGYQLELRIAAAQTSGDAARQALAQTAQADYDRILGDATSASLGEMDGFRDDMIDWILQLDASAVGNAPDSPQNLRVD